MKDLENRLRQTLRPEAAPVPDGLAEIIMARVDAQARNFSAPGPWWRLAITPATAAACLGFALMGLFISVAEAAPGSNFLTDGATSMGTTFQMWVLNLQLHVMQIITRLGGV